MKRILQIILAIFTLAAFLNNEIKAQTTYEWQNSAPDGNWKQGAYGGPRWNPGGLWDAPPSDAATILYFNDNTQTTMTQNVGNGYIIQKILFGSGATTGRTIGGNSIQFYEYGGTWPRIENQAINITHNINLPFSASTNSGLDMELVASAGPLVFGGAVSNNGRSVLVYGNNSSIDGINRYVELTGSGVIAGSGKLVVSQKGVAKINSTQTYTGNTEIDNGELWIEVSGGIASGSSIYVGNGVQLTNVAKLFLSNTSGGTTFAKNINMNAGNPSTRFLGGLNTSGTNTFSGTIANTASDLNIEEVNAGGTIEFSGIISGTGAVKMVGAGIVKLSAANTYTGTTVINGGTLTLGIANALPVGTSAGQIQFTAGTPTFNLGAFNLGTGTTTVLSAGALDFDVNTIVNLGNDASKSYYFKASNIQTWGASTITINNWTTTGPKIFVGNGTGSLSVPQLLKINFTGFGTGARILSTGEVVPFSMVYSKASGSWTSADTWLGGIPLAGANVVINNTHEITLDGSSGDATNVISSLKIISGGSLVFTTTNQTLSIAGGGSLINNGTFTSNTSAKVNFAGSATISGIVGFTDVILAGAGNVDFGTTSTIIGTLTISAGGVVITSAPAFADNSTLNYNSSGTYPCGSEWSTTTGAGNPFNVTLSSGVKLNMGALGIALARECRGNLRVESGCTFSMNETGNEMSQPVTIKGNITNSSGTIILSSISGGDLKTTGSLSSTGTSSITTNTSAVIFEGTSNKTISSSTPINNITINKTSGKKVSVTSYLNIPTALTITSGTIEIPSGASVTAEGTVTNSVGETGLVLKSDEYGTGSFTSPLAGVNATVERYLTSYVEVPDFMFHFLSSPMVAQPIRPEFVSSASTIPAGTDFYSFDEATNYWINSRATGDVWNTGFENDFEVGKGYLVAYPDIVAKNFTGILNPHTTSKELTCTYTSGKGNGWNLLGNPFSSAIDWDQITLGDGVDNALYYYDNAIANYKYYLKFADDNSASVDGGQQFIPATQGFMVHANAAGTDKTITIPYAARTHTGQDVYYKKSTAVLQNLTLKVEANGYSDEAYIHFNTDATPAFDGKFDAFKLRSYNKNVPMIFTKSSDGSELAINGLPEFDAATVIPVYFTTETAGEYTLNANLSAFENSAVYLKDLKTNTDQNLSENPIYTFTSEAGDDPNRFLLHFMDITSVPGAVKESFSVYISHGAINVASGRTANADIRVSNMAGQVVLQGKTNGNTLTTLSTASLRNGVYVVTLVGGSKVESRNIVVNR